MSYKILLVGLYFAGIVPLIGHCIATWYAVYLVKVTELEEWQSGFKLAQNFREK